MPTYDYRCQNCMKKFSLILSYQEYDIASIRCPDCGSNAVARKIGRIRVARSDESRLDSFPDTDITSMEKDPQGLGRMMRKMSQEVGETMPPEFNEVVGRLERGESPEAIEREMPDLGNELDDSLD